MNTVEPVTLTEALEVRQASLQILLVAPSPLNDPARLQPDHEVEAIYQALDQLRVDAKLIRLHPPTTRNLRIALANRAFQVIHIATHSSRMDLEFEDEDGTAVRVNPHEFAELFLNHPDALLILNGCSSEIIADTVSLRAPNITTVSIAGQIARDDALEAVRSFYEMLLSGLTVAEAAEEAEATVQRRLSQERRRKFLTVRGPQSGATIPPAGRGRSRPVYYSCSPPSNLPLLHGKVFDREAETIALHRALWGGESKARYIGVVGITGTGKTSFVQAAVNRYSWHFPDGIAYFSLRDEFSPIRLRDIFKWDLPGPSSPGLNQEITRQLARGRYLLILDDLDDASAGSLAELNQLLSSWDTSLGGRAVLILHTQHEDFTSLVGPNWIVVDKLPPSAALDLLTSCLGGKEAARQLIGPDLTEPLKLCFWHPRTIESTASAIQSGDRWTDLKDDASRRGSEGPLAVNDQMLGHVISRLKEQAPAVTDLLSAWSVFGTRCRELIWRTVAARGATHSEVLAMPYAQALSRLQRARLINREDMRGETICIIHPLVASHLRRREETHSVEKLTDYTRTHLQEQVRLVRTVNPEEYASEESNNIRQVLTVAERLELWSDIVHYCGELVGDPSAYLIRCGPWTFALELLTIGEGAATNCGDDLMRVKFLIARGSVQYRLASFDSSSASYSEALQHARLLDTRDLELSALRGRGQVLYRIGDFEGAKSIYVEAQTVAKRISDAAAADIDHQLAKILYRTNRLSEARTLLESVRAVRQRFGRDKDLAKTIHELGRIEHALGRTSQALGLYEEALQLERRAHDTVMEQATLFQLGKLSLELGNTDEARLRFRQSRRISESLGDQVWLIHAQFSEALVANADGQHANAARAAASAMADAQRLGIGLAGEIEVWLVEHYSERHAEQGRGA